MQFNSGAFAFFLLAVFCVYWIVPARFRWIPTLIFSYFFYMFHKPKYGLLIAFTTAVSYTAALMIEKQKTIKKKKLILAASVGICMLVLIVFKYLNFFSENLSAVLNAAGIAAALPVFKIGLPIGISFYTFQTASYVIDVYRGRVGAEHHFGKYAAFVSFFPQLVAGPIERADNLLPQIRKPRSFDYDEASYGLKLMAFGFFKKLAIADGLAVYTNLVFNNPRSYSGSVLLLATLFFTLEIYCDFSGSSDIAIGCARLFGVRLIKNFDLPYLSQSFHEFWSRWHISLSGWFRDYLYIPLGGNRKGSFRTAVNVMITFLISGLWHGAAWGYVIWGALHGFFQVLENLFIPKKHRQSRGLLRILRTLFVFFFVAVAWVFFVLDSPADALYVISHMFCGITDLPAYLKAMGSILDTGSWKIFHLAACILILFISDLLSLKKDTIERVSSLRLPIRWTVYLCITLLTIMTLAPGGSTEFIYFQF